MPSQTITWSNSVFLFFFLFLFYNSGFGSTQWQVLQPGLEYQDLNHSYLYPWAHTHVFRIDLNHYQLTSVLSKTLKKRHALIQEFAQYGQGVITINGGFFDERYHPLGLRISNFTEQNPLKSISWWSIFYIKENRAYISKANRFSASQSINFAIQSGPRLLIDGQIPKLKQGLAERSALGITVDGKLIILVTENTVLSTYNLANLLKNSPLNCTDALNLDGGSSSQLVVALEQFSLNINSFSSLSDAIIVQNKS